MDIAIPLRLDSFHELAHRVFDEAGWAHLAIVHDGGDGFALSYRPAEFPHPVRWLLHDLDEKVAAFALPSTCEPEEYLAERRRGNVQSLGPGELAVSWSASAGSMQRQWQRGSA